MLALSFWSAPLTTIPPTSMGLLQSHKGGAPANGSAVSSTATADQGALLPNVTSLVTIPGVTGPGLSVMAELVFAALAKDLLWLLVRPPREHSGLEAELSELLLHEALDPHRDRPSLLRAVETRRHAYRMKAA